MLATRFGMVAMLLVFCGGWQTMGWAEGPEGKNWLRDLQTAHRASQASNRPMVLVFGSENCVYCRKLEKNTLAEARVAHTLDSSFVPVYLSYEQNLKAAEILNIKALPCTVILTPQADLLDRIDGFVEAEKFQTSLRSALKAQAEIIPSSAP
jgi:thioredoxin-related protein